MSNERKNHWETIYTEKSPEQVSWTQSTPTTSLNLINATKLPLDAPIIDVGGGESMLVDHILDHGYKDITVLDISGNALSRCQKRLGARAKKVHWIEADITSFHPQRNYALWHDRAVFHFLTTEEDRAAYKMLVSNHVSHALVLSTFSLDGPLKCSGLPICQYNAEGLQALFAPHFELVQSHEELHQTPFNTTQAFVYTQFKGKAVE